MDTQLRAVLDATPIAHVATVLPDGAPHTVPVWIGTRGDRAVIMTGPGSQKAANLRRDPRIAISMTSPDNPYVPIVVRGRVVEWLDGEAGWEAVDAIAHKYIGSAYGRHQERVVAVIEVDHAKQGM